MIYVVQDDYTNAKSVIYINLLTYTLFKDIKKYHSCFVIKEKDEIGDIVLTDDLQIHFIELDKFHKKISEKNTKFDKWLSYFQNEGQASEDIMQVLLNDNIMAKAHEQFIKFSADDRMRDLYNSRKKWQLDYNFGLAKAEMKGIEQEGEEKTILLVKKILSKGLEITDIADISWLTVNEIKKIES